MAAEAFKKQGKHIAPVYMMVMPPGGDSVRVDKMWLQAFIRWLCHKNRLGAEQGKGIRRSP